MEMSKEKVTQWHYDGFKDFSNVKNAIATEWSNGEGIDVFIARKNLSEINISLTHEDIELFRKIFSDFYFRD